MVPGLLAIVLIMPTMALALALTREKETGTLEGLDRHARVGHGVPGGQAAGLHRHGAGQRAAGSAGGRSLVPGALSRQPGRLFVAGGRLFCGCMGIAVVIANFVKSQQTAMFIVLLLFLVPSFFLAGLITPVSSGCVGFDADLLCPAQHPLCRDQPRRLPERTGTGLRGAARPGPAGHGARGVGDWAALVQKAEWPRPRCWGSHRQPDRQRTDPVWPRPAAGHLYPAGPGPAARPDGHGHRAGHQRAAGGRPGPGSHAA